MATDAPEQLLDVFRAAALSVTKLYKTSASAQAKARSDGYQDCLDDLLAYLDKENLGVGDGEGWKIRRWATERLEGRDATMQTTESEDEAEKAETASSPEVHRSSSIPPTSTLRAETQTRTDSAPPPTIQPVIIEEPEIIVPTQDTFDFRSQHPYPNIANLDLSDSRSHDTSSSNTSGSATSISITRPSKSRHSGSGVRAGSRSSNNHLGRGAGQKRKVNFGEFFDLGNLGYGKDMFGGPGSKRNRHI